MSPASEPRFIVDHNVGKLAKWLRLMGYDAVLFNGSDDSSMIAEALSENRIILTRDTHIMKRRVVTSGRTKAILVEGDEAAGQMCQVIKRLGLNAQSHPFTLCLECNQALQSRTREQVENRVPPFVFKTQQQYMECPGCHRIYWRGTHWQAMTRKLEEFNQCSARE